jgi:hypothetical protein
MAAATASFGGALGAGKGEQTGFQRKIDTLDRAIRAHRIGDIDELRRVLAELRQAPGAPQAAPYGMPNAGAMAPAPISTWGSTFYDNILGMPLIGTGDRQPAPNDRAPDRPQARGVAAAPPNTGEGLDHDAILDQALRAAYVPPEHLEPHHFVGAAHLMAKEGLAPAEAYERFVMQSVRDGGLLDDGELQDLYGFGPGGEVQPASTPQGKTPEQRDVKRWPPTQVPTNQGRETGPSDSGLPVARSQDPPLAMLRQPPTTEPSDTRVPFVLAAMDESERRRLLGEKHELPSGGGGGGYSRPSSPLGPPASSFAGSRRSPLQAPAGPPRNPPGEFNGVPYSGHAIDQMQNRGIPPSVVDKVIRTGIPKPGKPGTTRYYDPANDVSVIRNDVTGNVITVRPGDR